MLAISVLKETEEAKGNDLSTITNSSGNLRGPIGNTNMDRNEAATLQQFYEKGITLDKPVKKQNKKKSMKLVLWKLSKYGKNAALLFAHIGAMLFLWYAGKKRLFEFKSSR
jgi:hypothetical protein